MKKGGNIKWDVDLAVAVLLETVGSLSSLLSFYYSGCAVMTRELLIANILY
jgi:hypothetical protein